MRRILHISKYYYPFIGGTEQIARDCVYALRNDYTQMVLAFNDGKIDNKITVDGIDVIKCGCFIKLSSQSLSFTYRKTFRMIMYYFKPDIIIFHYPNPFAASILMKELRNNNNTKLIIYWHLDITRQRLLKLFFLRQNKKLLNRASRVIATSPNYINGSRWLKTAINKCVVIPNCINQDRMKITPEIQKKADEIRIENANKIICVSVGRHTKYKGLKYLIQTSRLLDDRFRFYITGDGELTETLHDEAKNDKKIIFTGRIEDKELKSLILAADIFCFPSISKNEAFGLALAEAMYYEKPAVTFSIPGSGVNYVCLNGETGIEVENKNVLKYAEALEKLAADESLRKQYGKAGRKRIVDNFLSTQFYENIKKTIHSLEGIR